MKRYLALAGILALAIAALVLGSATASRPRFRPLPSCISSLTPNAS